MREIKFRAWDGRQIQDVWGMDEFSLYFNDGEPEDGIYGRGEPTVTRDARSVYELMQYTGLKDKNGVEIYESDIVKYTGRVFLAKQECFEVCYFREYGAYGMLYNGRPVGWDGPSIKYEPYFLTNYHTKKMEVIGSIYENPELLND